MNTYFQCSTQYENLGDLIINKLLVDELCKYGMVYVDTYRIPEKFKKPLLENENAVDLYSVHGLTCKLGIRSVLHAHRFLQKHSVSLTLSSPGPSFPKRDIQFRRKVLHVVKNLLFTFTGIKVFSIGGCCSSLVYNQEDMFSHFVCRYYLRSDESVTYVKKRKGDRKGCYIPDLCYLLKPQAIAKKEKIALFDIRLIKGKEQELMDWSKYLADQLISQGYAIQLYYQVERDFSIVQQLYEYLNHPSVSIRKDIVWYEDLDFYTDKKFVISNRLHSLLIGAAYGVYPICLYQESEATIKLKHVFQSSLTEDLPIIFTSPQSIDFDTLYYRNNPKLEAQFANNANLCKTAISEIVELVSHKTL